MKLKFYPNLFLTLVFILVSFLTKAQLPYFESFRNASASGIVFGGSPTAFLTASSSASLDPDGDGYLRLTNNNFDQKGYIYSQNNLTSAQGLRMQFEYYTYGGSGADGISFFLFDATANPFVIGGFGGSLGYSQFTLTNPTSPGVSKGYIGIGIDEYGNFSNPIEGRQGGIPGPTQNGLRPKSVTIRGKGDGNALTANNYPFLATAQTSDFNFSLVNDGNTRFPDSTTIGYRKAYIDLKPNPIGGYNITVRITVGGTPTKTYTVIDNFYYSEPAPALLRYGIASSTGNSTNFHEIRNVFIDIYDRGNLLNPTALNDQIVECSGRPSIIPVTNNDVSPNPGGVIQNNSIDLNPNLTGLQKTFLVPGKGTFTANNDGTVSYNPLSASVSGLVSVRYVVNDNYGIVSNIATITINEPISATPSNAGLDQLLSISTATGSVTLQGNSPSNSTGQWTQVSGPLGAVIVNPNSPNTTVNNMSLGTYLFRWILNTTGQCIASDDVQIIINAIPVAVNNNVIGIYNKPIQINIISNDTDRDGNNTIDNKSVVIKTNPLNGIVTVDPNTGIVTYTPNPGYSGPDSFTYTIKDITGSESNVGTVEIIIPIPPKIGLAKALVSTDKLLDESYNLKFLFTIINYSAITLEQLSLKDDLSVTFAGATYTVVSLKSVSPANFNVNNAYNGRAFTEMLLGNNQLQAQQTAIIELIVNVKLTGTIIDFTNTAFVEAISLLDAAKVTDQSTDGLKPDPIAPSDITPLVPTPINLSITKLFIPKGFSPNGDGINDFFVVQNTSSGLPVELEVFNRWGNAVYKSTNYTNNWSGKCSEGIYIGQDLPPGTYYYIVNYNFNKYVGYLTLNR
ncbi:T9SS type B sorting domain-containing protein [Pedobacter cryophilus]|nr:gliding motility-associated C-terminal domain-containing protein [Pedobacter cryophilus]